MATLIQQLEDISTNFKATAPSSVQEIINNARSDAEQKFANPTNVIQVGAQFPHFTLPDAKGSQVSGKDLLTKGPILITFYRGNWCPFCNIALRSLQQHLDQFHAKGVELVAISPELPDTSLSTQEKNELKFTVLSDVGNKLAREIGIVWKQPESMGPVLKQFGHDLEKLNGDDSLEVPVPATILVGKDGVVKNTYIEPDYTKRLEPAIALEWIDKL